MKKLIINKKASVVEMNTFRKIVILLGLGCNRKGDRTLVIMDKPEYKGSFWAPGNDEEYVGITTMDVDCGVFSDCLYSEIDPEYNMKGLLGISTRWMELVDFADTLWLIAKTLNPEFKISDPGVIGRGRRHEHRLEECLSELQSLNKKYNSQTDEEKAKESKLNNFFNGVELV